MTKRATNNDIKIIYVSPLLRSKKLPAVLLLIKP